MINFIKQFLNQNQSYEQTNQVEENKEDKIRIAVCALLLEIANSDDHFSDAEKSHITSILKRDFKLADEEVNELLKTAETEREERVELWHFANLINKNYSIEDKIRLIEVLWEIIYTDKTLDKHEDYLIHKLSNLLRLTHKQLIDAKLKALHKP